MRSKLRTKAPIGGDHHDVARSFLDAWIGALEMATFRQIQKANPEISSDLLEILSEVTDDDGRWIWISIRYSLSKRGRIWGKGARTNSRSTSRAVPPRVDWTLS
jgi:hypothetical protein